MGKVVILGGHSRKGTGERGLMKGDLLGSYCKIEKIRARHVGQTIQEIKKSSLLEGEGKNHASSTTPLVWGAKAVKGGLRAGKN